MQLIDFLQYEQFNQLRHKMGASDYGNFAAFDPERHLTQSELEQLQQGMSIPANLLHRQPDRTLSHKNSRVWVISMGKLHIADCDEIKKLRRTSTDIVISNQHIPADLEVCHQCLLELQYQGLDARRMRRVDYIEQLVKSFSMDEYYQRYPIHPLS